MIQNKKTLFFSVAIIFFAIILISGLGNSTDYTCKYDAVGDVCGELGAHCGDSEDTGCCGGTECLFNTCVATLGAACGSESDCSGACETTFIDCDYNECCGRHSHPCDRETDCCAGYECGSGGYCVGEEPEEPEPVVCQRDNCNIGHELCNAELPSKTYTVSNNQICTFTGKITQHGNTWKNPATLIITGNGPECSKTIQYTDCEIVSYSVTCNEGAVTFSADDSSYITINKECEDISYCGDGTLDQGEECDDGNSNIFDGCTSDCTLTFCGDGTIQNPNGYSQYEDCEFNSDCNDYDSNTIDSCVKCSCEYEYLPYCGDGNLDPGEECDDGNHINGDGCSSVCEIEYQPYCGNEIVDIGEECDDGNTNNYDGCRNDCVLPYCSDGILDSGEECDDGNLINGDGCSAVCDIECPEPYCGDGIIQTGLGEECDDGVNNGEVCVPGYELSCDYCSDVCEIEPLEGPYCGDGVKDVPYEECDGQDGVGVNQECSQECELINLPYCGDGVINPGEECDDGNNDNGDGCSSVCEVEYQPYCGNEIVDVGEECDDGNINNFDGCRNDCTLPYCGDEILDLGEECDDGNNLNGDGCSAVCDIECPEPYCGDGIVNGNEECDDGNNINGDGCSAVCEIESECYFDLDCGIDHCAGGPNYCLYGDVYQDYWIHTCNNPGEPNAYCSQEILPKLIEECECGCAYGFCIDCPEPYCGDGVVDVGEECDDGNNINDDGCSAVCEIEEPEPYCGDGNLDSGEECDDGNNINDDGCSSTCLIEIPEPYCGDGTLDQGEECDDGNNVNGDGCSSVCEIECPEPPYCGDGTVDAGEGCDNGSNNGVVCDNSEEACNYCSLSCEIIYRKGPSNGGDDPELEITCDSWGSCINGIQTRICYKSYGSSYSFETEEERTCILDFVPLGQGTNGTIILATLPSSFASTTSANSAGSTLGIGSLIFIIIIALLIMLGIIFFVVAIKGR